MMVYLIRKHTLSRKSIDSAIIVIFLSVISAALLFRDVSITLAQAPLTARVDRTTLAIDEQLQLTVTVAGDILQIPNPDLSRLTDFEIVGTSTSTQVSIINGKLTSQGSFLFRLQPLREGNLVIPSLSVEIDSHTYQTEPIEIEVTTGSAPAPPVLEDLPSVDAPDTLQGQDFFVEAELDNSAPYLGQQVVYIFRLYQGVNFLGQPDYEPPPFVDFWSQTTLSQPRYNTTAAGRNYLVTEIRTALFPVNIGPVTIAPAKLVIPGGLLKPDTVLETKPVTVNVRSLPEGAPADFNGAVGQFEIRAQPSETEAKVNEPITLVLEIEGAGNIEVLAEPSLPELPDWRIFDSQASTKVGVQDDVVQGVRRFERLIVPGKAGDLTIPSISFSYFDPKANKYRTAATDPLSISVLLNEAETPLSVAGHGSDSQAAIAFAAGDIRHIKPVPTSLNNMETSIASSPLYWSCWIILPAMAAGGVWIWQQRRERLLADSVYARRRKARRIAQKTLAGVRPDGDIYAAAHRALLGYLSDKLNRPTIGLTCESLLDLLKEFRVEPTLIERVHSALTQIEIGRFAPVEDAETQALVAGTRKLIADLEKQFED